MKALLTGAAGFIGSNLTDRLLAAGHFVRGFDDFSSGRWESLASAARSRSFEMYAGNLLDQPRLELAMNGMDIVFHLAANADVRYGPDNPRRDLEQNTIGTANVLEAMRACGVKRIMFASTGSVYGDARKFPTPEDAPFPVQTSLYGASKIAAEGLITAFSQAFDIQAWIFRFVSVLGERYTHGHVLDFYQQLIEHPEELRVLGNGTQRKSYLYVQDCIDGILLAIEKATDKVNILNLGTSEHCTVNESIQWISEYLCLDPQLVHGGGDRGWIGDNPFIFLDCSAMRALGWIPRLTIRQSILRTIAFLSSHRHTVEAGA